MSGPYHYREAEKLADLAATAKRPKWAAGYMQLAQVHATLALAAATALGRESADGTMPSRDRAAWFAAAAEPATRGATT